MATITKDGATWTNTYNQDGMRIRRTNGTVTYGYVYNGSQLSQMTVGSNTLNFSYDANGIPMSVSYNGTTYYYATNLQGDVTAILNASGSPVVSYTYDAWGKPLTVTGSLATTLGTHNPLRYRGYVYDTETELYYLQSRYYNPNTGRFLNADAFTSTGQGFTGNNMFVYCGNNPVVREDSEGNFWLFSVIVGVATQYISDVVENVMDGKTGADIFMPTSSVGEYIAAGVTALIPGTGFGAALVRNVVAEGITETQNIILGKDVNVVESIVDVGAGTLLDFGFEKLSDKATDFIGSKMPQNYSSYAHTVRRSNPSLTRNQIYQRMQRSIRFNRFASRAVAFGIDVIRTTLP